MTLDLTKPLQTRDGQTVKILHVKTLEDPSYPIYGLIIDADIVQQWTTCGQLYRNASEPHPLDLLNVPEVHKHLKGEKTEYISWGMTYSTPEGARNKEPDWPVLKITQKDGIVVSSEFIT